MRTLSPATEIKPGWRIPNLDGDGPEVVEVTGPTEHKDFGTVMVITVEGEDEPRHIGPPESVVLVVQPDA